MKQCTFARNNVTLIYIIADIKKNYCKIGYSDNPKGRLKELQVGMPMEIEIIRVIPGDIKDEKLLHKRFKDYKLRGEWFKYCEEIISYIETIAHVDIEKRKEKNKLRTLSDYIYNTNNPLGEEVNVVGPFSESTKVLIDYIGKNVKNKKIRIPEYSILEQSRVTHYRSILQLLDSRIIAKADEKGLYHVNPNIAFKGDRIALWREYQVKDAIDSPYKGINNTLREPESEYHREQENGN